MPELINGRKISEEDAAMFREMVDVFRSFSRDWVSEKAEIVAQLPDSAKYIYTFLSNLQISENDADFRAWTICALYFISIAMFYNEYSEENEKRGISEEITNASMGIVLHPEFIWSKIKYLYPDLHDSTDGTANPDGLAIAERMIDRWVKAELSSKDSFSFLIDLVHLIKEEIEHNKDDETGKREYRTRSKAGDIISLPRNLATITLPNWEHGVSLLSDGNAHLEPIQALAADSLKFEDGVLYFENPNGYRETFTEAHLQRISTREGITEIDLPLLRFYYSAILKQFEAKVKELRQKGDDDWNSMRKILSFMSVTFYVPELMERLGSGNFSERDAKKLISKTLLFHNILGIIEDYRGRKGYFPVLNFRGYDVETNTMSFESPYLSYLAREVYDNSIKRSKGGKSITKKNGTPALLPSHSYLVKPSIATERNKDAAINAMIIVTLIEQAGGEEAHINATELVRRNPVFEERLQRSSNKRQLLSRTFKKTWELLRTQTRLEEVYKDIKLPSPDDAASIPTPSSMENLVFTFKHKGKNND